jgi:hypothetical protein
MDVLRANEYCLAIFAKTAAMLILPPINKSDWWLMSNVNGTPSSCAFNVTLNIVHAAANDGARPRPPLQ